MEEDILEEFKEYIEEQKDITRSIEPYDSGLNYDFALELLESFKEELKEKE